MREEEDINMLNFLDADSNVITSNAIVVDGKLLLPVTKQFYIYNDDSMVQYSNIVLRFEFGLGASSRFDEGSYRIQVIESITEPTEDEWYAIGRNNRLGVSNIGPMGAADERVSIWIRVTVPPNQDILTINNIELICNYEESIVP